MEDMNFIRFHNISKGKLVDREKENFYNEGCPNVWDIPFIVPAVKCRTLERSEEGELRK